MARDTQNPGYVKLDLAKQSWTMKPVLSSTGAIRLEDIKDTTLLIQILNKSMLMNKKSGQRMVDGCMHEAQKAAVEELKKNPPTRRYSTPRASRPVMVLSVPNSGLHHIKTAAPPAVFSWGPGPKLHDTVAKWL